MFPAPASRSPQDSALEHATTAGSLPCHAGALTVLFLIVVQSLSLVLLLVSTWTVAHQAPLSTGFPREEYWRGLPFPSPKDHPDPRIEPRLLHWLVNSLLLGYKGSPISDSAPIY